jgi:cytochrome b6-f complex iron-sulfur subunit
MTPPPVACTDEIKKGRRRFMLQLSWAGLTLCSAAFLGAVVRFLWPRVSSRPVLSVRVGFPDEFRPGQVVYNRGLKLFIVRDEKGFLSFSARCTHLGCMVVWNRDYHMFLCPCHGGKFDTEGRNVEGPPPRPLVAYPIRIDDNGYLVVDQDIILKRGPGGRLPRFRPG